MPSARFAKSWVISTPPTRQVRTMASSLAGVSVAQAAAGQQRDAGGLAAAVAAGIGQKIGQKQELFLREQLEHGGILLWVKTHDDVAKEQAALTLLRRHGATEVHGRARPVEPPND